MSGGEVKRGGRNGGVGGMGGLDVNRAMRNRR